MLVVFDGGNPWQCFASVSFDVRGVRLLFCLCFVLLCKCNRFSIHFFWGGVWQRDVVKEASFSVCIESSGFISYLHVRGM